MLHIQRSGSVCVSCFAFLLTAALLIAFGAAPARADDVKKIKPPDREDRLSISYRPRVTPGVPRKYDARVGVLPMRDRRLMKFYDGSDAFFIDRLPEAIGDSLYFELKASGMFADVRQIAEPAPIHLTADAMKGIAAANNVDLLFVPDLLKFNLLREKIDDRKGIDFQIVVHFDFVGQLIEPQSGTVLWAERIARDARSLNSSGKVRPSEYTENAIEALQAGYDDMKTLLLATGTAVTR